MVAGNVVDRSPPFSTINKLGVTNVSSSLSCFVHIHGFSLFMLSGEGEITILHI